jgi:hypothetical protein
LRFTALLALAGLLALLVPLLPSPAPILGLGILRGENAGQAPDDRHSRQQAKQTAARARSRDGSGKPVEAVEIRSGVPRYG